MAQIPVFGLHQPRDRFSLLLLDDNDKYLDEVRVAYLPPGEDLQKAVESYMFALTDNSNDLTAKHMDGCAFVHLH